jgi:hypothetical protein
VENTSKESTNRRGNGRRRGNRFSWILVVALGVVVLIVVSAISGCSSKPPAQLVEERCVGCHALTILESSRKSPEDWEATVTRMVGIGAKLNEQQAKEVIAYLSETYGVDGP